MNMNSGIPMPYVTSEAGTAERLFAVMVLVLSTGAFVNLYLSQDYYLNPGAGMPLMEVAWGLIYILTIILLTSRCKGSMALFLRERWLVLLIGFTLSSALWSNVPWLTVRRASALALTCVFGLYFATRFSVQEQLRLLTWMFGAVLTLSFLFGWLHLGSSVDDIEGAWYGVFTQRNTLGTIMVFAALVFMLWGKQHHGDRSKSWFGVTLSGVLVYLSRSVTAFLIFACLFLIFPYLGVLRKASSRKVRTWLLAGCTSGVLVGYYIFQNFDLLTEALGRDPTLTGRTGLWLISIMMAIEKPWVGYGYSGFWLGAQGPSLEVWKLARWAAPSAHNGLLEIWIDLGVIGVTLFLIGFIIYFRRAYAFWRADRSWENAWPLCFLITLILSNLTESYLMGENNLPWILYIAAAITVSGGAKRSASRAVSS